MQPTKIVIVEDEVIVADNIRDTLEDLGYEVPEPAVTYTEALDLIEDEKPDLVLLDIQLGGLKDGIDLAAIIKEKYDIPFIFLTANADRATVERAKKVEPPAYLVKPFNREDLYTSIEVALYNSEKNKAKGKSEDDNSNYILSDSIFIKSGHYYQKVKFSDVLYLQSDHVYVKVITKDKDYLVRAALQEYINHFDQNTFIRVHRSYVVNMEHITGVDASTLKLGDKEVPLGRRHRDEVLSRLHLG